MCRQLYEELFFFRHSCPCPHFHITTRYDIITRYLIINYSSTKSRVVQHYISKETTSNFNHMALSLDTLPVEMVYRILDHLDTFTIFISCLNICKRLNDIINTYHRYQVILTFHFQSHCSSFFYIFIYIFVSK